MKKIMVCSILLLGFLYLNQNVALAQCPGCIIKEDGCRDCGQGGHANCMAVCAACQESGDCQSPNSIKKTPQKFEMVSMHFDKEFLLQLSNTNLDLAFMLSMIQTLPPPVGTSTLHWTPVEVTKDDLEKSILGDRQWLEQYNQRARETVLKGGGTAIFKEVLIKTKDNRLIFSIDFLNPTAKDKNGYYATFELSTDQWNQYVFNANNQWSVVNKAAR